MFFTTETILHGSHGGKIAGGANFLAELFVDL